MTVLSVSPHCASEGCIKGKSDQSKVVTKFINKISGKIIPLTHVTILTHITIDFISYNIVPTWSMPLPAKWRQIVHHHKLAYEWTICRRLMLL